ncbi:MAG TPA: UDP-N-acetylmuramoyl-L-alanyl-D-glutamate--2,6-diaminopimelate ligase [Solirubrobacteraceae bacterium]|nr:UDP-N-acetylmuramoyl-L-alanyl-D-glutamate--2,6-diaminopimelate ligase [Solirubrobacteraceae bacterium]
MKLDHVIAGAPAAAADLEISGLAHDTRSVGAGTLFFCVPGFTRDGHEFAPEAIARGAVALVVERRLHLGVPEVEVPSVRAAMAPAAAAFYGDPTARLATIGVTGTNGKTTTAFLVHALLEADARQTGLLGTVKSVIGGSERPVERTTPEAIDLQRTFREMLDGGDVACAMEVSSHALDLHRADAIHFAVGIFTNLTQDHLDFHGTMEEYFHAKRRLFIEARPTDAVINVDDPYGARLAAEVPEAITFAVDGDATYRASDVETDLTGSRFTVHGPDGVTELRSPLPGLFNVYNVLGALAAVRAVGVRIDVAAGAIETAGSVPGRFEPVDAGQDFAVLVDYAHTPDSLENVLRAARGLVTHSAGARVHVVFGCGGDRDRGKRPLMGEIAVRLADRVIVTSDNPRSEEPEAIIDQILVGTGPDVEHDADRRAAIHTAIAGARPGDVVVIAGKGHEQGQEFEGGRKIPFDDITVARETLAAGLTTSQVPDSAS